LVQWTIVARLIFASEFVLSVMSSERRIEKSERRIEALEKRLGRIVLRLDQMDKSLTQLRGRLKKTRGFKLVGQSVIRLLVFGSFGYVGCGPLVLGPALSLFCVLVSW
jgi:hypothetical protein